MPGHSSRRAIYAALVGNLLVAVTKFVAAALTGSSAMISEGVHSLVDSGNEVLLLHGIRRAARPPDPQHPLGHGRELYFWSFIVALLIFALGAGISLYEGIRHVLRPTPVANPHINYAVLLLSMLFEAGSWWVALKEFRNAKGELGYLAAIRRSKDPPGFMVLLEDTAALIGLAIALAGTAAAEAFRMPVLDGVASIGIGLLLGIVAVFLASETKGLLIGEAAEPEVVRTLCALAAEQPGIQHSNGLMTVQLGPNQVVAALSVDFADDMSARDVEAAVAELEERVRRAYPEIVMLLVKPQSRTQFQQRLASLQQADPALEPDRTAV